MRQEDQFQIFFYFLENLYMREKQTVCSIVLIYFDSSQLDIQ